MTRITLQPVDLLAKSGFRIFYYGRKIKETLPN
jgi:hypothetical protein